MTRVSPFVAFITPQFAFPRPGQQNASSPQCRAAAALFTTSLKRSSPDFLPSAKQLPDAALMTTVASVVTSEIYFEKVL
jgi:hypothetical protein